MPIRVKPVHDLSPCLLDMESIQGICELVDKTFHYAHYSATDGAWEIYDEESQSFLSAISGRTKLDSLNVTAPSAKAWGKHSDVVSIAMVDTKLPEFDKHKSVQLSFSDREAQVTFEVLPDQIEWVDHFMLDLKRHIRKPSTGQQVTSLMTPYVAFLLSILPIPGKNTIISAMTSIQSTSINLKKTEPNPTARSIRDNLASSVIYDVLKVVVGIVIAFVAIWVFNRFGVDINTWLTPPAIPTPTIGP